MIKESTVKKFITAVELDYGAKLSFEDAAKILEGITSYLLTLEKIYLRIKNNDKQ